MTKTQVEVITSVQRRRSWSLAEKERIVAAAMEPGAVAFFARTVDNRSRTRCAQGTHGASAAHKSFVKVAASPSGGTCSQSWVFSSNASLPPM